MRKIEMTRKTKETVIEIILDLDGNGIQSIDTGIGFLDHMLESFAFYSGIDLEIKCEGDLDVDDHHTVEDVGIMLGEAVLKAIGDRKGIRRFSSMTIPMDESLAMVSIDVSNRPGFVYNLQFENEKIGSMSTQNFKEFFKAFVNESRITLHINLLYGDNDHHKIEAVFKSFGMALKEAVMVVDDRVISTKGVL
ncbi:MAG: imidazoleglycerol-phosphate dehydratase HisB [Clostridiales bacterium]|nr:imidazoleglycerol-phosphate dehydratase HisB [Clostridiales bacterium]